VDISVRVVVVDNKDAVGYPGAAATYSDMGGKGDPRAVITIYGKKVKGKIVLPEVVLGHEMAHALEYQDKGGRFHNPDKLGEMGL